MTHKVHPTLENTQVLTRIRRNYNAAVAGGSWGYSQEQANAAREAMIQIWAECTGQRWVNARSDIEGKEDENAIYTA